MLATAIARHQRISPRKARTVLGGVRGKSLVEALFILRHARKENARLVLKVLESAVANAAQKHPEAEISELRVVLATADKAPDRFMRRWRPRAMGRATQIKKGMSHIQIGLGL